MHYVVTATLRLPAGSVVGLSDAQYSVRQHALLPIAKRKGWYQATTDLSFKVGEAIQYQGELPKALADSVDAPKRDKVKGKGPDTSTDGPQPKDDDGGDGKLPGGEGGEAS
jgi:hypothetical protein